MADAPQAPVLSIITGTINRPVQLVRMVESVLAHTLVPFELIIMDASDAPYSAPARPDIRIIHEHPRLGHTRGYNVGFQIARGEYALWLNDDAEVCPGYDMAGIQLLQSNPDVGLGCYYYLESGKWHVNMLYRMIFANFGILRRDFGNSIGWFDEDFYMYGADNSITFRTLLAGKGVVTVPGCNIIHHSEPDAIRLENQQWRVGAPALLERKYGSHRAAMQATYARTQHLVGPRVLR